MSITLNDVILDDDLIWSNEFDIVKLEQTIQRTVMGSVVISNFPTQNGNEIILEATQSGSTFSGYFTRAQVKEFKILEEAVTPVVFDYNGQVFDVIVKAGGVQVTPWVSRPDHDDTDFYTGTLTLVTL